MSTTAAQYHQIPLEKRIKPILDRIHIVRDLINRAEYEEKCGPDTICGRGLRIKISNQTKQELPAIQSDLRPECLRKNLKPIVFIIGVPTSESKHLAKIIERKYNLTFVSTGELIRKEIEDRTSIGQLIDPIVHEGGLVRPDIVVRLLKREMLSRFQCSKGYIIEGFPRTQEQLLRFEDEVARAHIVLFLDVDNTAMKEKLSSPEIDDKKRDILLRRICYYRKYTAPLKNEFGKRGKVIHGSGRVAWNLLDSFLAKMMLEWCFLKKDVTGMEYFHCGGKVEIDYATFSAPHVRGEPNKQLGACMFEIIGGVVPYLVQWNCARRPLGYPEIGLR